MRVKQLLGVWRHKEMGEGRGGGEPIQELGLKTS